MRAERVSGGGEGCREGPRTRVEPCRDPPGCGWDGKRPETTLNRAKMAARERIPPERGVPCRVCPPDINDH